MGSERLRVVGPEECTAPKILSQKPKWFVDTKDTRIDGRNLSQFRKIFMKTGMITQASGSAYIEMNNTKVICGVYGPRQVNMKGQQEFSDKGKLFCDFKYTTFSCNQRRGFVPDAEEKENSMLMLQALEVAVILDKFPKSQVDVYALIIQNDGAALSAAITCASLALGDAGIEMYDLVTACNVSTISGKVVLDPSAEEERWQQAGVLLAHMPSLKEITQILMVGELEQQMVAESVELCIDGCDKLYAILRRVLVESTLRQLNK